MYFKKKKGVYHTKMDGENHGSKPYCLMDDLGGKIPYFWKHPYAPWSKVAILGMGDLPPLIGNPYNGAQETPTDLG